MYCASEEADVYRKEAEDLGLTVHHNKHGLIENGVLMVTDPLRMRGLDYRSETGFTLVIATPFPNTRALVQGLGRVGRYAEPCERYVVPELNPVDNDAQAGLAGRLYAALHPKSSKRNNNAKE